MRRGFYDIPLELKRQAKAAFKFLTRDRSYRILPSVASLLYIAGINELGSTSELMLVDDKLALPFMLG